MAEHVHLPFDRMTCPHDGCESGKGKKPQEGTVPGIKRHVAMVHGQDVADKIDWPPIRTAEGPMSKLDAHTLILAAKARNVKTDGLNKASILTALAELDESA
jgi:hypothetical protein